jgi:hypothetical protein
LVVGGLAYRLAELVAAAGLTRAGRERRLASERLPAGARELAVEGIRGWLYGVTTTHGDEYQLFLWFDGSAYQVRVVAPDVWGREDLHACHLFGDARICFGAWDGGGMPTLDGAYAGSVAWAHGFSTYRRTGKFQLDKETSCRISS